MQKKRHWGKTFSREIDNIFAVARKSEAEMMIFFSDSPAEILKDCIARSNVRQIVLDKNDYEIMDHVEELSEMSEDVEVHIL
ncbi:hypothetical protein [Dethiosulfatibacter aminovorans]|uniref:hypothetical protein n=1 Tax=Dethiosulfatibacter aminovorans TaxID=332095 RepID=UPI0011149425|nr:hypothetical protein [Dethiosulfatibacter aminovorans]